MIVSIQVVSPASGDPVNAVRLCILPAVSIQVVSPASEDLGYKQLSINHTKFPFKWFPQRVGTRSSLPYVLRFTSFHSSGFPSEWGQIKTPTRSLSPEEVSIQVVSPTSGDLST